MEILVFILLKLLELSVVIFLPYFAGKLFARFYMFDPFYKCDGLVGRWFNGFIGIALLLAAIATICVIIFVAVPDLARGLWSLNWEWTYKLIELWR